MTDCLYSSGTCSRRARRSSRVLPLTTYPFHIPTDHLSMDGFCAGTLHVPAPKHDPQGYGSALTYARRYSLMAACGIAPEDDDGNAASQSVTADQAANIKALAEEVGKPINEICTYFGVKKPERLPAAQYDGIIKTLEKKREEAK